MAYPGPRRTIAGDAVAKGALVKWPKIAPSGPTIVVDAMQDVRIASEATVEKMNFIVPDEVWKRFCYGKALNDAEKGEDVLVELGYRGNGCSIH